MSSFAGSQRWRCDVVPDAQRAPAAAGLCPLPLCQVTYGGDQPGPGDAGCPGLSVPNRVLDGTAIGERWISAAPVRFERNGHLGMAADGALLAVSAQRPAGPDLEATTHAQFTSLLDVIDRSGYPHPLRVWNFVPGINQSQLGQERYRLFNAGRLRAFAGRQAPSGRPTCFPASSAVGTPSDRLLTLLFASTAAPLHVENPRQIPAYRYPPGYGPVPPSFCRATIAPQDLGGAFFLSGTASIVGHATRHADSVERQVEETLRNIEALIGQARCSSGRAIPDLADFDLVKVYLRRAGDLETVRAAVARSLRQSTPTIYLEADICRRDLLVEIDGFALA